MLVVDKVYLEEGKRTVGAEKVSASTEEQSGAVEEIAASPNSLASLGQELSRVISRFKP